MFAHACEVASAFTLPLAVSQRRYDTTVECALAAFMVVNDEGWFITAAHTTQPAAVHAQHQQEIAEYEKKVQAIDAGQGTPVGKKKRVRALHADKGWITDLSYWWAADGREAKNLKQLTGVDLLLGKLEPFDPTTVASYPVFKAQPDTEQGRSLCKLGFPFYSIAATFNPTANAFEFPPEAIPVPRFPVEGIWTRTYEGGESDGVEVKFIETSSPGLRGQSGGPIFDIDGNVRAMQTETQHFPLGFSPEVEVGGKKVQESQFLNVGIGVHSETIVAFLTKNGVSVATR